LLHSGLLEYEGRTWYEVKHGFTLQDPDPRKYQLQSFDIVFYNVVKAPEIAKDIIENKNIH
jgi:hypothetical protein